MKTIPLTVRQTPAKSDALTERARPACSVAAKAETMDLRSLFEMHYASMWRLLRRLGVRADQVDDATQEVFWVAGRRLSDIQPGCEHSFLYGVAVRVAASELRRQKAAMAWGMSAGAWKSGASGSMKAAKGAAWAAWATRVS